MARRKFARGAAVAVVLAVGLLGTASAQLPVSAFRPTSLEDPFADTLKGKVWTLHFAYIPPRITKIETPDKGVRTVWYMPYYVYNKSGAPRTFVPEFELVTKDPDGTVMSSLDESQPSVVDALRKIEDPLGKFNYHTSVSIAKEPIKDSSKIEAYPQSQAVYGLAVWLDVPAKANPNNFSIYVSGLSDGVTREEVTDKGETKVVISRKTLQLDFRRPSASAKDKSDDIKVNDNNGLGADKWIYRQAQIIPKKKPTDK